MLPRSSFYSSASSDDGDSVVTQDWGEMAAPPAPQDASSPPRFNRFLLRGLVDPNPGPVRESPPASAGRERLRSSREWQGRVATALSRSARLGASVDASDENGGSLARAAWKTPGGTTPARRSVQLEDGAGAGGRLFGRELRSNRSLEVRRAGNQAAQLGSDSGGTGPEPPGPEVARLTAEVERLRLRLRERDGELLVQRERAAGLALELSGLKAVNAEAERSAASPAPRGRGAGEYRRHAEAAFACLQGYQELCEELVEKVRALEGALG